MSNNRDDGKASERHIETVQVRVRSKNPLIERLPPDRLDSQTQAEILPDAVDLLSPGPIPTAELIPATHEQSEVTSSIYERLEHTDGTEQIEQAQQEMESALLKFGIGVDSNPGGKPSPPPRAPRPPPADRAPTRLASSPAKNRSSADGRPSPKPPGPEKNRPSHRAAPPLMLAEEAPTVMAEPESLAAPTIRDTPEAPGAIPMERLAALRSDAAGAALAERLLQRRTKDLPEVKSPALKLLRSILLPQDLFILDQTLAGALDSNQTDGSVSPKRALERLINERHFGDLELDEQGALLCAIAQNPADITTLKAALALLKTTVFRRLKVDDRHQLLAIFYAINSEARARIAELAARRLRGHSALEDNDLFGARLVTHLEHLATGREFSERLEQLGVEPRKVVSLVVGAIAHPERLSFEEGHAGALSLLEFSLADTCPAQYARMWRDLVEGKMSIELPGGGVLDLSTTLESKDSRFSGRQTPFRVAMEELVTVSSPPGRNRKYSFVMQGGSGLDAEGLAKACEQLFGTPFLAVAGYTNIIRQLSRVPPTSDRVPPAFVSLLYERGERLFVFDHLDPVALHIRAPHGRSTKPQGAFRIDPHREVVDPDRGVERVSRSLLESTSGFALIPRPR